MYSVIKSLVASHSTFNLTTFTSYFDQIRVDPNATVGQVSSVSLEYENKGLARAADRSIKYRNLQFLETSETVKFV